MIWRGILGRATPLSEKSVALPCEPESHEIRAWKTDSLSIQYFGNVQASWWVMFEPFNVIEMVSTPRDAISVLIRLTTD